MSTRFVRLGGVLFALAGVISFQAFAGDDGVPDVSGQATSVNKSIDEQVYGPPLPGYLAIANAMRALNRAGLEWDERRGLVTSRLDPFEYFKGVDISDLPLVEPTEGERRKVVEETFGREFIEIADDVAAGRKHPAHVRFRWDEKEGRVVTDWDPYCHDGEIAEGKRKPVQLTELQRRHIVEQTFGPEFLQLVDSVAAGSVHPRQVRFQWDNAQQHVVIVREGKEKDRDAQLAVELPDGRTAVPDPSNPAVVRDLESVCGPAGDR